jgi:hypothetical protein
VVTGGGDVRGGLDDALEKMARRDELRRRAAGQAAGTPPAVTELVEAVAAVVARNPELAITMGVEGAGEPVLLQFAMDDGIVQVSADSPLPAQSTDAAPVAARHADFEPVDDAVIEEAPPAVTYPPHPYTGTAYDEGGYDDGDPTPLTYERRHAVPDTDRYGREPAPSPLAATPPSAVPPQTRSTARVHAAGREQAPLPQPREQAGPMPLPGQVPTPLRHEPEATELAAKRLAALLREDPSLLHPTPPD